MKKILASIIIFACVSAAQAEIKTKVINYKDGSTKLQGFLAYDDAIQGKRPGVLVVHEWWGHGDYVRMRAKKLAELGFIAFALDMYGKGVYAKDHKEAAALSGEFRKDNPKALKRAKAGLSILKKHKLTNTSKIAAIGYCFGGSTVLALARAGWDLAAVVSFHGGLATNAPAKGPIKAKVLVNHGGDDGFVKPEDIAAFQKEMNDAGADWQMNIYGGAVHSFTVEAAGNDPSKGMAYNKEADRRSWAAMKNLFKEVF